MVPSSAGSDASRNQTTAAALLVTADALLFLDLQLIFQTFAIALTPINSAREALAMLRAVGDVDYVLLDSRMPAVEDGSLVTALGEWGLHRRGALALIAVSPGNEWVDRLQRGLIDDIVPLTADASTWHARLGVMQRSRRMHLELEERRLAAEAEMERDAVTGSFSREMMLKLLFRETDRVQRLRGELSFMLIAIEGFEDWVEELGQQVGDSLLREVVGRVGRALRTYDLLGRMGKHLFLVALPGCSLTNARRLAERMRVEVFSELFLTRNKHGEYAGIDLKAAFAVTASLGRSPLVVLREAEALLEKVRLSPPAVASFEGAPETQSVTKGRSVYLLPSQDSGRDGFHWLG